MTAARQGLVSRAGRPRSQGRRIVLFSHGQESGPWGTKITALAQDARDAGLEADSIDYRGMADPAERAQKLIERMRDCSEEILLVGSSMGGYVGRGRRSATTGRRIVSDGARAGGPGLALRLKKPYRRPPSLCTAGRTASCRLSGASTLPAPTRRDCTY